MEDRTTTKTYMKSRRHIPLDLCEKILFREGLELKDLLRFKCVCRAWNDLIYSSRFAKQRLELSQADPGQTHHKILQTSPLSTFDFNACGAGYIKSVPNPQQCFEPNLKIVGSSDGLVCLCSFSAQQKTFTFLIWNPGTKEVVTLSEPIHQDKKTRYDLKFYGFSRYSNCTGGGTYKLVLGYLGFMHVLGIHYVLYSLNSSSGSGSHNWRRTRETVFIMEVFEKIGTFLDGILHWPANKRVFYPAKRVVISYDWSREEIRKLRLPDDIIKLPSGSGDPCFTLGVFDGCLSVLTNSQKSEFEVWTMKQYGVDESWSKLMELHGFHYNSRSLRPLGYLKDGDLLVDVNDEY